MKDFYEDNGSLISRLYPGQTEMPEFLKTAEFFTDVNDLSNLDSNAFADSANRKFPIYDKASAFVSAAYIKLAAEDGDVNPDIDGKVKTACALFGIESEVLRLSEMIASRKIAEREKEKNQKTASLESSSWTVSVSDSGFSFDACGSGADSLREASREFLEQGYEKTRPISFVKTAAIGLVDAAKDFACPSGDLPLEEDVLKLAGLGCPDNELLAAYVSARRVALNDPNARANFSKVASALTEAPPKTQDEFQKLASFLSKFDEENNLRRLYGKTFPDPLRTVHNVSVRKIAQLAEKVEIGGQEHYLAQIETPSGKRAAFHVMGDNYSSAFTEDGEFDGRKVASLLEGDLAVSFNQVFSPPLFSELELF